MCSPLHLLRCSQREDGSIKVPRLEIKATLSTLEAKVNCCTAQSSDGETSVRLLIENDVKMQTTVKKA